VDYSTMLYQLQILTGIETNKRNKRREFVRNGREAIFKLLFPRDEKRKIRVRMSSFVCRMK
jgi:hypothetical protein